MKIGDKLKKLREYHGFSQSDIGRRLEIAPRNISNYETVDEISGMLDYVLRFCDLINMPVAEFFMEDMSTITKELPSYITPANAAMLKILNTQVDIKTRIKVEEAFVCILEAILVQYGDRLQHLPEHQEILKGKKDDEGKASDLKVADRQEPFSKKDK